MSFPSVQESDKKNSCIIYILCRYIGLDKIVKSFLYTSSVIYQINFLSLAFPLMTINQMLNYSYQALLKDLGCNTRGRVFHSFQEIYYQLSTK